MNPVLLAKLEVYAVMLVLAVVAVVGAYLKGGADRERKIHDEEARQLVTALQAGATAARARETQDETARAATEAVLAKLDQNLSSLDKRFAHVPQVVLDGRGCPGIGNGFRVRWNAAELGLPRVGPLPDGAPHGVPDGRVPAP